jgi:hypothetical protein
MIYEYFSSMFVLIIYVVDLLSSVEFDLRYLCDRDNFLRLNFTYNL